MRGAGEVTVEQLTGQPVLQVKLDPQAIARFGTSMKSRTWAIATGQSYAVTRIVASFGKARPAATSTALMIPAGAGQAEQCR